jgi:hypothetical protein
MHRASASISARSAVSPFIFQFPAASLTRIAMLLLGLMVWDLGMARKRVGVCVNRRTDKRGQS